MDSIHGSWTSAGCGPWWTGHHGRSWCSPELGLAVALGHGGLPQGGEKKEGVTGSLFWLVPRLGRRRGGGAPAAELQLRRAMAWARWGLRGELEMWGSSPRVGRPFIGRRRGGRGRVPLMAGVEGASMLRV
jgi:hypothetical protein